MNYVFTFLEGIASFISPCLLPMLPIYISYLVGNKNKNTKKALLHSIGFVIGFTITFVVLSVLASSLGGLMSDKIKYLKIVFGILIIILGFNYMEIFTIQFLNKTKNFMSKSENMSFLRTILFGMLFSISWTPCVGAFLSAALMLIAKEHNIVKGILLILIYSMGLGVPFVISAILLEKLKETFEWIKQHYGIIKKVSGMILIFMGVYLLFF